MKKCSYCSQYVPDNSRRCMFCGRNLDLELAKKIEKQKADRAFFLKVARLTLLSVVVIAGVTAAVVWAAVFSPLGSRGKVAATQTAAVFNFCHPDQVAAAAHQLIELNDKWADVMAVAVSVDQDNLVLQVDRLQRMRRDARDVAVPDCMKEGKDSLIAGMDEHIYGLLQYMRGKPREEVNEYLKRGNLEMNAFADAVEYLQKCAPVCR